MKTLILANGEGTRLRPLTEKTNKAMLQVGGKPILEHIICHLKKYGFKDIVIAVGIKKEQIMNYFKDGSDFGVEIRYSVSNEIQQTAGEIAKAKEFLEKEEDFLLYYGDTLTNLDLENFYEFHKKTGAIVTGPGMKEIHTESGIYICGDDGTIHSFHEKPFVNDLVELPGIFSNVPIYLINQKIWDCENIAFGKDFNADVVSGLIERKGVKIFYQNDLWHLDVGNLKKYKMICAAFENSAQAKLRKLA